MPFIVNLNFAEVEKGRTNVEPWDPTKAFTDPEPGAYEITNLSATPYEKPGSGRRSAKIVVEMPDGSTCDVYRGLDFSKEANWKKFLTMVESHGGDTSKMRAKGVLDFDLEKLVGKKAYLLVKLNAGQDVDPMTGRTRKRLNDKEFMTRAQYEAYVAQAGSRPHPTAGTPSGVAQTPSGANGSAEAVERLFS